MHVLAGAAGARDGGAVSGRRVDVGRVPRRPQTLSPLQPLPLLPVSSTASLFFLFFFRACFLIVFYWENFKFIPVMCNYACSKFYRFPFFIKISITK